MGEYRQRLGLSPSPSISLQTVHTTYLVITHRSRLNGSRNQESKKRSQVYFIRLRERERESQPTIPTPIHKRHFPSTLLPPEHFIPMLTINPPPLCMVDNEEWTMRRMLRAFHVSGRRRKKKAVPGTMSAFTHLGLSLLFFFLFFWPVLLLRRIGPILLTCSYSFSTLWLTGWRDRLQCYTATVLIASHVFWVWIK